MSERLQALLLLQALLCAIRSELANPHAEPRKDSCAVRNSLIAELTANAKEAAETVESMNLLVLAVGGQSEAIARVSRLKARLDIVQREAVCVLKNLTAHRAEHDC